MRWCLRGANDFPVEHQRVSLRIIAKTLAEGKWLAWSDYQTRREPVIPPKHQEPKSRRLLEALAVTRNLSGSSSAFHHFDDIEVSTADSSGLPFVEPVLFMPATALQSPLR
jgi:hypothetical protein